MKNTYYHLCSTPSSKYCIHPYPYAYIVQVLPFEGIFATSQHGACPNKECNHFATSWLYITPAIPSNSWTQPYSVNKDIIPTLPCIAFWWYFSAQNFASSYIQWPCRLRWATAWISCHSQKSCLHLLTKLSVRSHSSPHPLCILSCSSSLPLLHYN